MKITSIRTGQLISTFGVGSLIPVHDKFEGAQSFIVAGLDYWRIQDRNRNVRRHVNGTDLFREERLQSICGVEGFLSPPATTDDEGGGDDIPVYRFPLMVSCPECHSLRKHNVFGPPEKNKCTKCNKNLVPSRFLLACYRGHLEDFPYEKWVHGRNVHQSEKHDLKLTSGGTSASLSNMVISCETCKVKRDMKDAFTPGEVNKVAKCSGLKPWMGPDALADECSALPRVLQRGASNVWFPITKSALVIPPWSKAIHRLLDEHWPTLSTQPPDSLRIFIEVAYPFAPYTTEEILQVAIDRQNSMETQGQFFEETIRKDEYIAIVNGQEQESGNDEFLSVQTQAGNYIKSWTEKVMQLPALLEVRALDSFTRVVSSTQPKTEPSLVKLTDTNYDQPKWIPGVEVYGEGIFIDLDKDLIKDWEDRSHVKKRFERLEEDISLSVARLYRTFNGKSVDEVTRLMPRFYLVHTLAHVLINQLSVNAGYPASSLRERLYVDDDMVGILIYTSSGSSAGSMGGLVSHANSPDRLDATAKAAIETAEWCSNDPLCIQLVSGSGSVNLGACHACVLLPEVSCELMNGYLDRATLKNSPALAPEDETGFFDMIGGN